VGTFEACQRAKLHSAIVQRAESVLGLPPITAYQEALIRNALQDAGVEFTNHGEKGVKRRHEDERGATGTGSRTAFLRAFSCMACGAAFASPGGRRSVIDQECTKPACARALGVT